MTPHSWTNSFGGIAMCSRCGVFQSHKGLVNEHAVRIFSRVHGNQIASDDCDFEIVRKVLTE